MRLLSLEPESSASANSAIPAYNLARSRVTLAVPEIFTAVHLKISTAAPFLPSLLRPLDALVFGAVNSGQLYERPTLFQLDIRFDFFKEEI